MRLYLASTSPARLKTLRQAGIEPALISPGVDEESVAAAAAPQSTQELVALLARAKAEAVAGAEDIDGLILGGDSAFELDGVSYGKPHDPAIARERWRAMRGRTGILHSGHWLIDHRGGAVHAAVGAVTSARLQFAADMTDEEIDAYVATGEPLEVAGAFTIDGRGAAWITSVEGDPHAVVGLSLATLRSLVVQLGIPWTSLWNRAETI